VGFTPEGVTLTFSLVVLFKMKKPEFSNENSGRFLENRESKAIWRCEIQVEDVHPI
jgi:hypothetical protein